MHIEFSYNWNINIYFLVSKEIRKQKGKHNSNLQCEASSFHPKSGFAISTILSFVSSLSSFLKKRHGTPPQFLIVKHPPCQTLSFLAGVSFSISKSRTTINHYAFCRRASSERTMVICIQTPPVRAKNFFGLKGEVKEDSQKCNPGIQSSR